MPSTTTDDELITEFVVESNEHLADIESQLLSMETAGADVDSELVNTVFRAIHSIKGAAGFFGLTTINTLTHRMENVLNLIRNGDLISTSKIVDVLLKAADTLQNLLNDTGASNGVDVSQHLAALDTVAEPEAAAVAAAVEGLTLPEDEPAEEPQTPNDAGPAAAPIEPEDVAVPDESRQTAEDSSPTERSGSRETSDPRTLTSSATEISPAASQPTTPEKAAAQAQAESPQPVNPKRAAPASSPAETNIRVSVGVLDLLMNLAGELVLSRNRLLQIVGSRDWAAMEAVVGGVDQVTSELQEAIMQTRMQPVGHVFGRFRRVVRDLSAKLGKSCQLDIDGAEVEVDKSILEAIGDPLTHLIRNAVDHGLEMPDQRVAAGKPAGGVVHLRAFHQAGKVNITVRDDGRGIDAAKLKEKAVSRGLISSEQADAMSQRDAVRLILHAGFSTAETVSDVSGRGVGMDVVRTNIEKLGGTIEIETEVGSGTTIDIKLPLTLAIVPSLIVGCDGRRFAIPQTSISELVRVKRGDAARRIELLKDAEVFRLRGTLLPLVRLERALDIDGAADAADDERKSLYIVVVESGNVQYGLIADALHDSEEIVVKPLGRHLQDSSCLAGATILGDGKVALILDVAAIASHTQLTMPSDTIEENDAPVDAADNDLHTMLLLRNHPREWFAVPMALVRRLERIRAGQIDTVGGKEILQYRGGTLPLLRIENLVSAAAPEEAATCHVVVFGVADREVGLLVPELVDIHQIHLDLDTTAFREPGVVGSLVFDGATIRILDLYELTRSAHPEWFSTIEIEAAEHESGVARILLAEDSGFFRRQVVSYMEEAGYEVVGCEDGLIAWNTLQERGAEFDLVVTDIEMPNMDGCQLARRIKDDPSLSHLPVIALTSLSSEEDMQRGMESGIDDYQVKLDRERLMVAVVKYLQDVKSRTGSAGEPAAIGIGSQS